MKILQNTVGLEQQEGTMTMNNEK